MALSSKERLVFRVVFVAAVLCSFITPSMAELPRFKHAPKKPQQSLHILVVGDWGRQGTNNQSFVADQVSFSSNLPLLSSHKIYHSPSMSSSLHILLLSSHAHRVSDYDVTCVKKKLIPFAKFISKN